LYLFWLPLANAIFLHKCWDEEEDEEEDEDKNAANGWWVSQLFLHSGSASFA